MPESVYVWPVEDAPLRVELERGVARKLREAVAAAGTPEIGGFLLGTTLAGVTRVSGYELVECEHRRGEAYDLTPLDRLKFSRRCAPWLSKRPHEPRAVGFFRTHARPGLFLDGRDLRTVQEFFSDASQVVLLVRREPHGSPVAGFFIWEAGNMERRQSRCPFALDEAAASAETPVITQPAIPQQPAATSLVPVHRVPQVRAMAVAVPRGNPDRWRYGVLAACIPLAAGLAYYAGRHDATARAAHPNRAAALEAQAAPAPATASPGPPQSPQAAPFPMPVKRSPMDAGAAVARNARARAREEDEAYARAFAPVSQRPSRPEPAESVAPPTAVARLETPAETPRQEREPEPSEPRFRPELHPAITVEAGGPSDGLGHKLARLPKRLLTLGRPRHDDGFTPARPLREVAPAVPTQVARELTSVVPVAVRISVDAGGRVRDAELLSDEAHPQLANLALTAARKWEFIAARQNDMPVASSVVARFRFRPPLD